MAESTANPETTAEVVGLEDVATVDGADERHESHVNPPELPALRASRGRTKLKFKLGLAIVLLDLAVLPIVYFYALRFATDLDLQTVFAVLTGVFGMLCFLHYAFRSLRLFMHRTGKKYRPLGWERWGLAEFLHVNIAGIIFCIEVELVVGTIPHNPWIRVCAMATATICFYSGFLLIGTAILSMTNRKLPFNMSSIPKGSPWRPALYPIIEDFGALEMSGERAFRRQLMLRYDASVLFRRMLLILTWAWGIFFLVVGSGTTVAIMLLSEEIGFGIGWGMPWIFVIFMTFATVWYVRKSLKHERAEWRKKCPSNASEVSEPSVA